MDLNTGGLLLLAVLSVDIWAAISVASSTSNVTAKVLWIGLISFLPVVGFLVWAIAGPRP